MKYYHCHTLLLVSNTVHNNSLHSHIPFAAQHYKHEVFEIVMLQVFETAGGDNLLFFRWRRLVCINER